MKGKLLLIFLLFSLYNCSNKKVVKIGYISNLSGRHSELGIRGRDGFLMAIDEYNDLNIEYIIKDHQGDKALCYQLTKELVLEGVEVIIGPLTSGMAESVINGTKGSDVLIISPTVSSDKYTGIDDNFLRITPVGSNQGMAIGSIIKERDEKKVTVIADKSNLEYAEGVIQGLKESITYNPYIIFFNGKEEIPDVIEELKTVKGDAFFFIASGIDTALIIQNLKKDSDLPSLYGSSWVKVSNIESHGGKSIEGMIVTDNFIGDGKSTKEIEFNRIFKKRYNTKPNLPAIYTYESTLLFLDIKRANSSLKGVELKDRILNLKNFKGIQETFSLDKYGDVNRKQSIFIIRDNIYEFYKVY